MEFVTAAGFRQYDANMRAAMAALTKQNEGLRADLDQMLRARESLQKPRFIEDIPGPRAPYTYALHIPFAEGVTTTASASLSIATDGPFICTQIAAFWRITDTDSSLVGRWLPVTQTGFRIHSAAAGPPTGSMEFAFKITTGGSGRAWQSDWLGGPLFDTSTINRPWYQGIAGWIERANTLSVEARPEFAVPTNAGGDVWMYFHGYQILIPINLSEQFGWSI